MGLTGDSASIVPRTKVCLSLASPLWVLNVINQAFITAASLHLLAASHVLSLHHLLAARIERKIFPFLPLLPVPPNELAIPGSDSGHFDQLAVAAFFGCVLRKEVNMI